MAQVVDYGSDLWKLSSWVDFDDGVVRRYLISSHAPTRFRRTSGLQEAAAAMWGLDDAAWGSLTLRLDQVLKTGDFHFVVAAQRFTDQMRDTVEYLNETCRYGQYFLVELVRLDGNEQIAYAAQVVHGPALRSSSRTPASRANETDFLAAIGDPSYHQAMQQLFATVASCDEPSYSITASTGSTAPARCRRGPRATWPSG